MRRAARPLFFIIFSGLLFRKVLALGLDLNTMGMLASMAIVALLEKAATKK